MRIANPIYDCVFKFLMQDKASAKVIISAITEFEIEDLELRPTEVQVNTGGLRDLTVYRLDLAAKVKTSEGSKLVTIEIQKALTSKDIMRFRRYVGSQYSNKENYEDVTDDTYMVSENVVPYDSKPAKPTKPPKTVKRAMPIFTIYILGYNLKTYPEIPVIKVKRNYYDNATKELLTKKDEFIESLTHDSAVIQVQALAGRRRDRLEKVLSIFDQTLVTKDSLHSLVYKDHTSMPKEVQKLIRRLKLAFASEEIRNQMILQDEVIDELAEKDRHISELQDSLETTKQQAEKAEQQAVKERQQKEKAEQKAKALLDELNELKRKIKNN
jgi:hypothetical protein